LFAYKRQLYVQHSNLLTLSFLPLKPAVKKLDVGGRQSRFYTENPDILSEWKKDQNL